MLERCTLNSVGFVHRKFPVFRVGLSVASKLFEGPKEIGFDVWGEKEDVETRRSQRLSVPGLATAERGLEVKSCERSRWMFFREEAHCIAKCINFLINYT